jgi:hypothetical protein
MNTIPGRKNSAAPRWTGMDLALLGRVRKSAIIAGVFIAIPFATYFGWQASAGWTAGIIWSLLNLHFSTSLIKNVLTFGDRDVNKILIGLAIKFPVLYLAGLLLLRSESFPAIWLVAGFTWPFFVLVLKGFSRAYLGMDNTNAVSDSQS